MTDTYYKATNGTQATHGGTYRYPGTGRWTRHLDPGRLDPCRYGYHLARNEQILDWLAPTLWIAEPCPDHPLIEAENKVATCRVRLVERLEGWNERTARLFAADCAEAALHLTGPDTKCVDAIRVARLFADGKATREEVDAARAAAWDAAWAAAGDAAAAAAWDAARAATGDAAAAAAWATARAADWAAASAADWAADSAAASAATRDADWAATRDAARDGQYNTLLTYLGETT